MKVMWSGTELVMWDTSMRRAIGQGRAGESVAVGAITIEGRRIVSVRDSIIMETHGAPLLAVHLDNLPSDWEEQLHSRPLVFHLGAARDTPGSSTQREGGPHDIERTTERLMVSLFRSRAVLAALKAQLSLAIAEVVGQSIKPNNLSVLDGFVTDKTLGWALPAGQQMQWRGKPANINNLGMRSPAPRSNPQARILMVGDSSMFGDGVTDAETMVQLARLLPNVDVQNAGVLGYTCIQTRELIERIQPKYRPDVIVSYNQQLDFRKTESHDQVVAASTARPLGGYRNRHCSPGVFCGDA